MTFAREFATTPKNRSYDVRRDIADAVGAPHHLDFAPATYVDGVVVTFAEKLADGKIIENQGWLLNTSNAGFRGIEGWIEMFDGRRVHRCLGEVVTFEVWD